MNNDEFDKIVFEHYKNPKYNKIPLSSQNAIENAFSTHKNKYNLLKRIAIFIIGLSIAVSGTIYANDIFNIISKFFNNSNRGIDTAIDNGYIQNINMDFFTCNGIGIKSDYILMDNTTLDISLIYTDTTQSLDVKNIKPSELIIKNEKNDILCYISELDHNINSKAFAITSIAEPIHLDNFTIRDSLLVTSQKFSNTETLYIEISKILVETQNEKKYIYGNWNFSINLSDKIVDSNTQKTYYTPNEFVNNITLSQEASSLKITLELNTLFNENILYSYNSIPLKDENNNIYNSSYMYSKNNVDENTSTLTLIYPISKYNNIKQLFLDIKIDSEKNLKIEITL